MKRSLWHKRWNTVSRDSNVSRQVESLKAHCWGTFWSALSICHIFKHLASKQPSSQLNLTTDVLEFSWIICTFLQESPQWLRRSFLPFLKDWVPVVVLKDFDVFSLSFCLLVSAFQSDAVYPVRAMLCESLYLCSTLPRSLTLPLPSFAL